MYYLHNYIAAMYFILTNIDGKHCSSFHKLLRAQYVRTHCKTVSSYFKKKKTFLVSNLGYCLAYQHFVNHICLHKYVISCLFITLKHICGYKSNLFCILTNNTRHARNSDADIVSTVNDNNT